MLILTGVKVHQKNEESVCTLLQIIFNDLCYQNNPPKPKQSNLGCTHTQHSFTRNLEVRAFRSLLQGATLTLKHKSDHDLP